MAGLDDADLGPDIVQAESTEVMPSRKDLIVAGDEALTELGYDPDDFVDAYAEAQMRRAMPENTRQLLRYSYGFLIRYCGDTGRRHDPPTVGTIRQMIADCLRMVDKHGKGRGRYGQPYAPNTVATVVYCLSMIFDRVQWANPCRHPFVADQLKGYREDFEAAGFRTDEADALTNDQSVILARSQDLGTVQGVRNAAMFRGQFDLGARADEWCKVWGEDVAWIDDNRVNIKFVRTKGRKSREVGMQALPEIAGDVDPVRLFRNYYEARLSAGWNGRGPVWVEVHRGDRRKDFDTSRILGGRFLDKPWGYAAYAKAFGRAVDKTGIALDPVTKQIKRHFTTHSNRIGLIDGAFGKGMRLEDVASRTGHSPGSRVIADYLRLRAVWDDDNPGVRVRRP